MVAAGIYISACLLLVMLMFAVTTPYQDKSVADMILNSTLGSQSLNQTNRWTLNQRTWWWLVVIRFLSSIISFGEIIVEFCGFFHRTKVALNLLIFYSTKYQIRPSWLSIVVQCSFDNYLNNPSIKVLSLNAFVIR